jgi:CheY-like chemotaxis protein
LEPTVLAGRCILVVEDEPLISLDIATRLQHAGARVLAASHLEKALELAECRDLAAGVLDFDLGKADSTPVCWKLVDRQIPFVFHSGRMYSAFQQWPSAPVVLKPATESLIGAVAGLFRLTSGRQTT